MCFDMNEKISIIHTNSSQVKYIVKALFSNFPFCFFDVSFRFVSIEVNSPGEKDIKKRKDRVAGKCWLMPVNRLIDQ